MRLLIHSESILTPAAHSGSYKPQSKLDLYGVEVKIDGIRGLAYSDPDKGGKLVIISRNGNELYNVDHIIKDLSPLLSKGYAFDGELFYKDWSTTSSIIHTQAFHPEASNLKFYIFDMLLPEEVLVGGTNIGYAERRLRMIRVVHPLRLQSVKIVERYKVSDPGDVDRIFSKYISRGHEGVMVKTRGGSYFFGKSTGWYKKKKEDTYDLKIVDAIEGTGKYVGKLGALVLQMPDGSRTKVGTGFNDSQRSELWNQFKLGNLVGKYAEVKSYGVSVSNIPRGPLSFVRVRWDKPKD